MKSFALVSLLVALLVLLTAACSGGGGGGGGGTPPVAQAMSLSVAKDKARSLVLAGTPATADNSLVYQVLSRPQHGSLSGTAPNLSFTPATGYVGADRFDFSVSENGLASVRATVRLFVSAWTEISPSGGFVSTAAFHPSTTNELWVCADDGGGLYKSVDTGATWTLQQNTPLNWSAYAFVFDLSNSSVLYAPL